MMTHSTGYPELDQLIGWEPSGPVEWFEADCGNFSSSLVARVPVAQLSGVQKPLGFPRGCITVVEGLEVPEGWSERLGAVVCLPNPHEIERVLLLKPPLVFVSGEALDCDYRVLTRLLQDVALVVVVPGGVRLKALKYHCHLRLRFSGGEVAVIKNMLSAYKGAMRWPF